MSRPPTMPPCRHTMITRRSLSKTIKSRESNNNSINVKFTSNSSPECNNDERKRKRHVLNDSTNTKPKRNNHVGQSIDKKQPPLYTATINTDKHLTIKDKIKSIIQSHLENTQQQNLSSPSSLAPPWTTRGGWSLLDGLTHIATANNGILLPLIERHGPPPHYFQTTHDDDDDDTPHTSFQSLCRIVAGQQLAGPAAAKIYSRLLSTVGASLDDPSNLTPKAILDIAHHSPDEIERRLRQPAGLSNAKTRSIIDLANRFQQNDLSEDRLYRDDEEVVRSRLLSVKGLGPWSCDMFLLFHAHRPDVLPLGDLGVRKGTTKLFGVRGKGKNGVLCDKKDEALMKELQEPFAPYRSLSTYYVWRCVDTVAFNDDGNRTDGTTGRQR